MSPVWDGNQLSEYFQTYSGVNQGCLLSPILFALFLNDLNDNLKGGLMSDGLNMRLLLYADDPHTLKAICMLGKVLCKLESHGKYCKIKTKDFQ